MEISSETSLGTVREINLETDWGLGLGTSLERGWD